jgi:hypothetical protein
MDDFVKYVIQLVLTWFSTHKKENKTNASEIFTLNNFEIVVDKKY